MKSLSLNSPGDNLSDYILCFYTNITSQLQIIKITNIANYSWQKAIFPGQKLMFTGMTSALLEIYTSDATAIPSNVIPCQQLRIVDELVSAEHCV